jgi:hypothetical protein
MTRALLKVAIGIILSGSAVAVARSQSDASRSQGAMQADDGIEVRDLALSARKVPATLLEPSAPEWDSLDSPAGMLNDSVGVRELRPGSVKPLAQPAEPKPR